MALMSRMDDDLRGKDRRYMEGYLDGYSAAWDRVDEILHKQSADRYPTYTVTKDETAPVTETKHGRWKHHQYGNTEGYYECDNCGKINSYESNYCPKCGADMREVEE